MTENKCCGFCLKKDPMSPTGECMITGENVKFDDCCEYFVPSDWSFKK